MLLGDPSLNPRSPATKDRLSVNDPKKAANGLLISSTNVENNVSAESVNGDNAGPKPNDSKPVSASALSPSPMFTDCDLDVLHATSAALIDASRDILICANFEIAMKVLTSWVPIQDEDLFMRVVKAEWKERKRRVINEAN